MRTGEMLEYTQKLLEYSRGVRRQVLEYSRDVHIDKYWNIVEMHASNAGVQQGCAHHVSGSPAGCLPAAGLAGQRLASSSSLSFLKDFSFKIDRI